MTCAVLWCTALACDTLPGYCAVHLAQWDAWRRLRDGDGNLDLQALCQPATGLRDRRRQLRLF